MSVEFTALGFFFFLNVGKLVLLHISNITFIMGDLDSRHWVIAIEIQVHELYTNQAF